ncbi:MAG: hypothetical protein HKL89_02580, partial [Candidatus Dormibacteraeota bacterium]|nr:hypothetical protein [Candidatus Dormibacteraeota bacterium]
MRIFQRAGVGTVRRGGLRRAIGTPTVVAGLIGAVGLAVWLGVLAGPVSAQTPTVCTWSGTSSSLWSLGSNWTGTSSCTSAGGPTSGTAIIFPSGATTTSVTYDSGTETGGGGVAPASSFNSITFEAPYTVSEGASAPASITLSPTAATPCGSSTAIALCDLSTTPAVVFHPGVTLGASGEEIASVGSASLFLDGVISGPGANLVIGDSTNTGLVFLEPGDTSCSSPNIYAGPTTVGGGDLYLACPNSLPSGTAVTVDNSAVLIPELIVGGTITNSITDNGTVDASVWNGLTQTLSGNISGSGTFNTLDAASSGTTVLSGTNSYSGTTTVATGTLAATNPSAFGASSISVAAGGTLAVSVNPTNTIASLAGTLQGNGSGCGQGWNGPITLTASTATIENSDSNCDFLVGGAISGAFAPTFTNPGGYSVDLESSSGDSFTGASITSGSVGADHTDALGTSGTITVSSGARVVINTPTPAGAGVTLDIAGSGPYSSGALFGANGGGTWSGPVVLTAATTFGTNASSDTLGVSGAITGSNSYGLTTVGAGTTVLSAANNYTGTTTVAGGILQITNDTALGTGPVAVDSGATVQLASGIGVANSLTLNGAGAATSGASAALEALSGSDAWNGAITLGSASSVAEDTSTATLELTGGVGGTGPLTVAAPAAGAGGLVVLLSPGTYSGGTIILDHATARIGNSGALSSGTVTVQTGGELQAAGIATLANALQLSGGGVGTTGSGALEWSGANLRLTQPITLDAQARVADANDGHFLTLAAGVTGTGLLITAGAVVLPQGQSATNSGGINAVSGTLRVDGAVTGNQVSASGTGTVYGAGSAAGLHMMCGANLSPGDAGPGILTTTSGLSLACGTVSLDIALDGTTAGSGYSQVSVSSGGTIALGGASLNVGFGGSFTSASGDVYDIISNQGGSAPSGVLTYGGSQLPEGATFTVAGRTLQVSYAGGSGGHDVTLTDVTNLPPPPSPTGPMVSGVSPAAGSTGGGTSVTVTGTGFTGATAVAFGGTPAASFKVVS